MKLSPEVKKERCLLFLTGYKRSYILFIPQRDFVDADEYFYLRMLGLIIAKYFINRKELFYEIKNLSFNIYGITYRFFHLPESISQQNVKFFGPQNARLHFEKFSETKRFLLEFLDLSC